jgi:hypothetical protein
MAFPFKGRLIGGRNAVVGPQALSAEQQEDEEEKIPQEVGAQLQRELQQLSPNVPASSTATSSAVKSVNGWPRTVTVADVHDSSIGRPNGSRASIFIAEGRQPPVYQSQKEDVHQRAMLDGDMKKTVQSTSTTLADDEQQCGGSGLDAATIQDISAGDSSNGASDSGGDVAHILKWFQAVLGQIEKNGRVQVRDLKQAVRDHEVRYYHTYIHACIVLAMQEFAENFFKLFDVDRSGAVSIQELVGSLGRLTTYVILWLQEIETLIYAREI